MFSVNKPAAVRVFLRLRKRQRRCFQILAVNHCPGFSYFRFRGVNLINVLFKFDIIMFTSRHFFLFPMLIKHTQPSGQVKTYPVLISDAIDSKGRRLLQYANGAEVPISEEHFIYLELAQSDLSNLVATSLPSEVIRRDMLH